MLVREVNERTASVIVLNQAPGRQALPVYLHSSVLTASGPEYTTSERACPS